MSAIDRGQVNTSAAEVYQEFFVPALFAEWTKNMIAAAHIQPGHRVLDVACGTGVLARDAAKHVGQDGSVIGLDINPGMLAVAERTAPEIEWRHGAAESMPFEDDHFDAVMSQFALMFFEDRQAAIREMHRVLRPGGRLVVAVWDSLDNTPGYATMVDLLQRLFGEDVANKLRAPFILGDVEEVRAIFDAAGVSNIEIETLTGTARFPSVESWVFTDIKGWTLADSIDDDQYDLLLKEAGPVLARYETPDGAVAFDSPAHIISATK